MRATTGRRHPWRTHDAAALRGGTTNLRIDSVTVTYLPCDVNVRGALVERASVHLVRRVRGGGKQEGFGGTVAEFTGVGGLRGGRGQVRVPAQPR